MLLPCDLHLNTVDKWCTYYWAANHWILQVWNMAASALIALLCILCIRKAIWWKISLDICVVTHISRSCIVYLSIGNSYICLHQSNYIRGESIVVCQAYLLKCVQDNSHISFYEYFAYQVQWRHYHIPYVIFSSVVLIW